MAVSSLLATSGHLSQRTVFCEGLLKSPLRGKKECTKVVVMSERLRESLSAMMDDEANELEIERVLSQVAGDGELRETWSRYQYVRGALSGQSMGFPALDVSASVRDAIDNESSVAGQGSQDSLRQRLLRPLASLAVAASVTATVVVGGQQLAQIGAGDPGNAQVVTADSPSPVGLIYSPGGTALRASYRNTPQPVLSPVPQAAYNELARQKMEKYMQEHAEHAALNSPQGLIPFSRVPQIKE